MEVLADLESFYLSNRSLLGQMGLHGIYALSIYVVLAAGQLSLGQAAFGGISAYVSVLLTLERGWPFPLVLLAGVLAAVAASAVLGLPVLRLRGVFLAIATIGFGEVVRIVILNLDVTGGAEGLDAIPRETEMWHIWAALAGCSWVVARMGPSRFGRSLTAVREDETAARAQGVYATRVRFGAFVLSGALAGLAGALDGHFSSSISPGEFGFSFAVEILVYAIVGGTTVWFGPIMGAGLITLLPTLLREIGVTAGWVRGATEGLVLLAVILFLPEGLSRLVPRRPRVPAPARGELVRRSGLALRVDDVSLSFGGVSALAGVSLSVAPGEVLGLVGPNGAGKTTLVNVVTGIVAPSSGRVLVGGSEVTGVSPERIARLGVARTFQNLRLFGHLSALDNVMAGAVRLVPETLWARLVMLPSARRREAAQAARAAALLEKVGLGGRGATPAAALPYGDRRRLEVARALASDPGLVVLDEPAAGMNHAVEADRLVELIRAIAAEGRTVVLIEHNLAVVRASCDRVAVLNFGRLIATGDPAEVSADPQVVEAYLGA